MSGHSKWATTKHAKGLADAKRGAVFTKLGNNIAVAARQGGGDPDANFKLRLAIDRAKQANMPKENIERAVKKGTGELGGAAIEEIVYEGFGPAGVAVVIEALTDNNNRTVANVRKILTKYGGSFGAANSTLWMFERKGAVKIQNYKSKIENYGDWELKMIDLGAEDIREIDGEIIIYARPEDLGKIKEALEKDGLAIDGAEMELVAKNTVKVENPDARERLEKMFAELDEDMDVNDYYSNIEE